MEKYVVTLQCAATIIESLKSFDLLSREYIKQPKASFEINGQPAGFSVVDLWGRRLAAEELLKTLHSGEIKDEKSYAAGLVALKSALSDLVSAYFSFAVRAGLEEQLQSEGTRIFGLLRSPGWPSESAIAEYLRTF